MWKQVRSVHERSLVTGALIHAYLPSAGRAVGGSGKALSPRSPALMTVFMLTHTGRVPSFQLLITFGHRRRPEISLPLYHFFTSLQKSSRGRRYELASPGQAAAASSRHIFPPHHHSSHQWVPGPSGHLTISTSPTHMQLSPPSAAATLPLTEVSMLPV